MKKFSQIHITPAEQQNAQELASACPFSWEHHMCQSVQSLKKVLQCDLVSRNFIQPKLWPYGRFHTWHLTV